MLKSAFVGLSMAMMIAVPAADAAGPGGFARDLSTLRSRAHPVIQMQLPMFPSERGAMAPANRNEPDDVSAAVDKTMTALDEYFSAFGQNATGMDAVRL